MTVLVVRGHQDQKGSRNLSSHTELDTIVTPPTCETSEDIDDALRAFIDLAATHKGTRFHISAIGKRGKSRRIKSMTLG